MSGNEEQVKTIKKKYGKDWFKHIGFTGGRRKVRKGFAVKPLDNVHRKRKIEDNKNGGEK